MEQCERHIDILERECPGRKTAQNSREVEETTDIDEVGKKKGLRRARPPARTDDLPCSPKTNSDCSAGCRITSLACHQHIIPSQDTIYIASDNGVQVFWRGQS